MAKSSPSCSPRMGSSIVKSSSSFHLLLLLLHVLQISTSHGFMMTRPSVLPSKSSSPTSSSSSSNMMTSKIILEMAKARGKLGSIVDSDSVSKKTRTVPKKRSKRTAGSNKKGGTMGGKKKAADAASSTTSSATISPLLQEWAASSSSDNDDDDDDEDSSSTATTTAASTSATSYEPFETTSISSSKKKTKSTNNAKKSTKQIQDEERQTKITNLVQQVQDALDTENRENKKKADITNDIIKPIQQLTAMPNANTALKRILATTTTSKKYDYRLVWAGSDTAVCHVGTGLHNVPLARLQEIFWTCQGKSRVEILEVIRVLGPFPNVRNTLEGPCKIGKKYTLPILSDDEEKEINITELMITYDSMIDGTGKQITAGGVDNVRKVVLHVLFCDENAIVAVVPNDDDDDDSSVRQNPFDNNGANILFYTKEDALDEKLDALRVL